MRCRAREQKERLKVGSTRPRLPLAFALITTLAAGAGCVDSETLFQTPIFVKTDGQELVGDFEGCTTGTSIDSSRIRVEFAPPSQATRFSVYRNGTLVFSTSNLSVLSFVDAGLDEGQTYTYSCEATIQGKAYTGTKILNLATLSYSAPIFGGATAVSALSGSSAQVSWSPTNPGSVAAATFKIYANTGSTVDFTRTPRATVAAGAFLATVTGLADEVPYAFGVRACSASNVCDTNTVSRPLTMPDGGSPKTVGALSVEAQNGALRILAPWTEADGGVLRRKVYVRSVAPGAAISTNLADYTLDHTEFVSNLGAPQTSILISNGVSEFSSYHVMVIDIDPTGNTTTARNVATITTGDLTKPNFNGITALANVTSGTALEAETKLEASFTAIARQNSGESSAAGAAKYVVFLTQAPFGSTPTDPCLATTPYVEVSADPYAPGAATLQITGLSARTTYRVCLQAKDNAGNQSTSTSSFAKTTLDKTPPIFDGLQSLVFNNELARLELAWNPALSSDTALYEIKLWRNNADPALGSSLTEITRAHPNFSTGMTLTQAEFPFQDNDTVYAQVNACDTAALIPGGAENCTSGTMVRSRVLPDITPPPGFNGILSSGSLLSSNHGEVTIAWSAPADWSDYKGFKVYEVQADQSLLLLKDCACPVTGCAAAGGYTQCTLNGLTPYQTYKFHVRAYDASGNVTQTSIANKSSTKRVLDTVGPSFNSGLQTGAKPTYALSWQAATDDQSATEPGASIRYRVYRRAGTTFTNPMNPDFDASTSLRAELTNTTTFADTGQIEGTTYYYTVCALDATGNRTCDATVRSVAISDLTPPVLGALTSTKDTISTLKTWVLSWGPISDNVTSSAQIVVKVFQKISTDVALSSFLPDEGGVVELSSVSGGTSLSGLYGPSNILAYVNYRIELWDAEGNRTVAFKSVTSDNRITIANGTISTGTLPAVHPNSGVTTGGTRVLITGSGFRKPTETGCAGDKGTEVWFGSVGVEDSRCTDVQVFDDEKLTCLTPAKVAGAVSVTVTQPDAVDCGRGSQASLNAIYTYKAAGDATLPLCARPSDWTPAGLFANSGVVGSGASSLNPWIICNSSHLKNIEGRGSSKFFALGANIELKDDATFSGSTANSIASSTLYGTTATVTTFQGGGYALTNFGRTSAGGDGSPNGLFQSRCTRADAATCFQNTRVALYDLHFLNALVTSRASRAHLSLLIDYTYGFEIRFLRLSGTIEQLEEHASENLGSIGGVTGTATGASSIQDSYLAVTIRGTPLSTKVAYVGGLVGSTINSGSTGLDVDRLRGEVFIGTSAVPFRLIAGTSTMGGVLGGNRVSANCSVGAVEKCGIRDVDLKGELYATLGYVGGIMGYDYFVMSAPVSSNRAFLRNRFKGWIQSGTGGTTSVGGLLGYIGAGNGLNTGPTITDSSFEGTIVNSNGTSGASYLGGLLGTMHGRPADADAPAAPKIFARNRVRARFQIVNPGVSYTGGLAGWLQYDPVTTVGGVADPGYPDIVNGMIITDNSVETTIENQTMSINHLGGLIGNIKQLQLQTVVTDAQQPLVLQLNQNLVRPSLALPSGNSIKKGALIGASTASRVRSTNTFWDTSLAGGNIAGGTDDATSGILTFSADSTPSVPLGGLPGSQNSYTGWNFYDSVSNPTGTWVWDPIVNRPRLKWVLDAGLETLGGP